MNTAIPVIHLVFIPPTLARSRASPATATNLPADVLADILWFCFDPSYASVTSATAIRSLSDIAPRPYLGVCRQWRDVAHYACKLWAQWEIFIIVGGGHSSFDEEKMFKAVNSFIKDSIARSGNATMHFYLRVAIGSLVKVYSAQLAALVGLLVECQSRWEHTLIDFYPCHFRRSIPLSLAPRQLHRLRDLDIAGDWHLMDLHVSGMDRISIPTLNHLSLSRASLKSCKIWLSICPNLTTFTGCIESGDDVDVGHLHLVSLKAMELKCLFRIKHVERFAVLGSLFDSMTCRALERFGMRQLKGEDNGGGFEHSIERFMERSQHQLSTLSIHSIDSVVLLPSFRGWPSISTLHICCEREESPILRYLTSEDICPTLASVSIAGVASSNEEYVNFITSRWNSVPRMLQTVRFVGCYSLLDTSADGTTSPHTSQALQWFSCWMGIRRGMRKGGLRPGVLPTQGLQECG